MPAPSRYPGLPGFDVGSDDVVAPSPAPDPIRSLRENPELVSDLARYAEGICTESAVRRRWKLAEEMWEALGGDDELVQTIEQEKTRRIRNGSFKRELAQLHVVRGPTVLASIMDDPRANARHRVDSVKALNAIADPGPEAATGEEKVIISINLGADLRAKGQEPDPSDVITIEATPRKQIEDSDDWRR